MLRQPGQEAFDQVLALVGPARKDVQMAEAVQNMQLGLVHQRGEASAKLRRRGRVLCAVEEQDGQGEPCRFAREIFVHDAHEGGPQRAGAPVVFAAEVPGKGRAEFGAEEAVNAPRGPTQYL